MSCEISKCKLDAVVLCRGFGNIINMDQGSKCSSDRNESEILTRPEIIKYEEIK